VDGRGTPLGVTLTGANRHDSMALASTLDAIPPVRSGKRGRPRRRPAKLHADKAYDHRRCRRECANVASSLASRAGAWTAVNGWDATDGWSSAPTPGWLDRYCPDCAIA
jgi:hypothetical protein